MTNSTNSAAYFGKTTEVDEFLNEFIRFRRKVLNYPPNDVQDTDLPDEKHPYRRSKFNEDDKTTDDSQSDKTTQMCETDDNLLNVAIQMTLDNDLHLDAFISLVDAYDVMLKDFPDFEHSKFYLSEILKNARITSRKFPKIAERTDMEWSKMLAYELKYQRQMEDVRERLLPKSTRVSEFKPPIISGLNILFGVTLTFIGAYSISGSLGMKDPLHRSLVGIGFSFLALIVDTVLYLLRSKT